VILDGENAWAYYPDGGLDFIRGLYRRLTEDPGLRSTTFRDYLDRHAVASKMHEIFTGSWINNNFAIWIGQREDNRAWDLLCEAREALVRADAAKTVPADRLAGAWEELFMAEGSDWCWWYGDDHTSGNDEVFDALYRQHLMNIYHLIGEKVPEGLFASILENLGGSGPAPEEVTSLISPRIDGRVSSYFEWLGATSYEIHRRGSTMHRTDVPVSMFYYGINVEQLFLRIDFRVGYHDPSLFGDDVLIHVFPSPSLENCHSDDHVRTRFLHPRRGNRGATRSSRRHSGHLDILEAGILWTALGNFGTAAVHFTRKGRKHAGLLADDRFIHGQCSGRRLRTKDVTVRRPRNANKREEIYILFFKTTSDKIYYVKNDGCSTLALV
jgi:hypothetical protein